MWLQEAKVHNGEHPASNGEVSASGVFDPRVKLSDRNELAALQLAEAKCLSLLSLYPTTLQVHVCPLLFLSLSSTTSQVANGVERKQEDQAALRTTSLTPNMRAVTLLRLKEKEILNRTLDAIRLLKGEVGGTVGAAPSPASSPSSSNGTAQQPSKNKKRKNRKKKTAAAAATSEEPAAAAAAASSSTTEEKDRTA
jgi:hypothetical protein